MAKGSLHADKIAGRLWGRHPQTVPRVDRGAAVAGQAVFGNAVADGPARQFGVAILTNFIERFY